MKNKKIQNIAFSAMFTALICILSQISFLTPTVPVTLQTFGIALCGYTLSVKWSAACVATYVALGSLGLPVFSNFKGGMQVLFGPTGGFLWGFILLAVACSLAVKSERKIFTIIISAVGLLTCNLAGMVQYSIFTGNSVWLSFLTASLPFVLKDIISLLAAFFLAKFIKKRIMGLKF